MTGPDPFFIVGSVRSGTTMLRDLLRSVPGLCCPEETHFYRWAHPYGTRQYENTYRVNKVILHHHELDGITADEVGELLDSSRSRREFSDRYMALFALRQGLPADTRWFDKTPQNVFGLPLLAADYPGSRFVHVHRDPRNVVASLVVGRVMKVDSIVGASNYWRDSVLCARAFGRAEPDRMLSVSYRNLTNAPEQVVGEICGFVDLEPVAAAELAGVRPEQDGWAEVLTPDAVATVAELCGPLAAELGYSLG